MTTPDPAPLSRTGAEVFVDTLVALGTDDVFTLCGNHVLPIVDVLRHRDVCTIATRAEAAAVFAADAYARVSRKVGVVLVTGGPGMSNAVTGLLTARGNRSPIVVVSGEPDQDGDGRGSQQETDHLGLSAPVVGWHRRVARPDHIEEALVEAFRVARSGRTGPVHVSIPLDVQRATCTPAPPALDAAVVTIGSPPAAFVATAADVLRQAERPVAVAGAGLWQGGGEQATARFVERTGIPLFSLDSARGIVADSAPGVMGSADRGLNAAAHHLAEADVVVVAGRALDFRLGLGRDLPDATVIHVDTDLAALGRNARRVHACLGDPGAFLADLTDALAGHRAPSAWVEVLDAARERQRREIDELAAADADGDALHPAAIARTLGRIGSAHGAIYALDCGEFAQWCRQVIPSEHPGHWLRLGPQSTCGAGLPFGLGAKVARPDAPVLVIAGDGGIGYHLAELETARREGIPLVVVVGHDEAWGIEQNLQRGIYGDGAIYTTSLGRTDFAGVAQGWGAVGVTVSDLASLEAAVLAGFVEDGPTLIQIPVRTVPSAVTLRMIQRERDVLAHEV